MAVSSDDKHVLPAMVLSTHNTGLAIIRSLGERGIPIIAVYYENRDMGYVSRYVKYKISTPHPEQAQTEFIECLINLSQTHGRCVLFPCDDGTLAAVSKHMDMLSHYHLVACPSWDVVRSSIDKPYTYQRAESLGIPLPKTVIPKDFSEVKAYCQTAYFPCLVKPRQSHIYFEQFRKKMVKVQNIESLEAAYHEAVEAGIDVMLQEYIEGPDTAGINYNSYFWDSRPLAEFTAQKVRLSPPDAGVPSVVISKKIPEVLAYGRQLLEAFGYQGYSCMEFKKDPRDGLYKLLEINARHNRSSMLAVRCGINFPWIEYQHRLFGHIPRIKDYRQDLYWIDMTRDLSTMSKYIKRKQFSIAGQIKPYLKPNVFAVFSLKDPMPFIKRCVDIFGIIISAVVRPLKLKRY